MGIIGAGPGGLALGIFLKKAGFRDFTIFDREDGVGGTWRINTYPGLACDVKSHLYSYSFDLNANWSRLWSGQPEILEYFERCAQRYELGPHLKLNTEVVSARWDADTADLAADHRPPESGTRFDIVVSAVGLFTQPVLPDLVEEEPFTGTVMHTAKLGPLRRPARRAGGRPGHRVDRVAAGPRGRQGAPRRCTRCSARRPGSCRSRTAPYTDREKWLFAHVPFAKKIYRTRLWLRSESNICGDRERQRQDAGVQGHRAARHSRRRWPTRSCASKLTPDHPFGCKRLVFATDYLQTLTQPHVEVVSSPARALRVPVAGDRTTAASSTWMSCCARRVMPRRTTWARSTSSAKDGTSLRETWRDGAYAYLGMAVPGFPNFFMLYGPNTNVGSNSVIFMLEAQAHYIVRALEAHAAQAEDIRRGAARDDGGLHRQDRRVDGGHRVAYPLQQLLPRRQRSCRHPVAAQRPRVLGNDPAIPGRPTTPSTRLRPIRRSQSKRTRRRTGADGSTFDIVDRLDPALRHLRDCTHRTCRRTCWPAIRESLNQRRRSEAQAVDTAGGFHRGHRRQRPCPCASTVAAPARRRPR